MGRALLAALLAVSTLVVGAAPAGAKCGATILGLSVSGPGLPQEIDLSPEQWGLRRETDPATANALFGVGVGPAPTLSRRPAEITDLGPRYTVRYDVIVIDQRGRSAGNDVRIQHVFPYATGAYGSERAVAFTPRQMWETACGDGPERAAGGWWAPFPPDMVRRLERFGLRRPDDLTTSGAPRTGAPAWPVGVGVAAAGLLLAGWLATRSRGPGARAPRSPRASRRPG